jgi:hypothetical protein
MKPIGRIQVEDLNPEHFNFYLYFVVIDKLPLILFKGMDSVSYMIRHGNIVSPGNFLTDSNVGVV